MGELNVASCVSGTGANTALPSCVFAPGKFVGAILVDSSFEIAAADIPNIITKLQEKVLASGKNRIFPIFRFEEVADNSEDVTIQTLGYGSKSVVKDGKYDWSFRQIVGGLCLQARLRAFNKTAFKVLFVDSDNIIYGTRNAAGTGLRGLTLDFFYASPFKANDGSNAAMFHLRFALAKPSEFNENIAFVQCGVDIEDNVKGNIDIELTQIILVQGQATIGLRTRCEKINLYETFADNFADGDLWKCNSAGTGLDIAITSVVKNSSAKGWDVSFIGAGEHTLSLVDPKALSAANIGGAPDNGYEGNTLTVIMPGSAG